ncbi:MULTISPECIES: TetR/AcrR family transcriptional regulator [unclassified Polaromonas]|jgi:AcrR family transcriptional regulator|uniref:TetR/AcrR family transcriptional regulator n=1 Tax=unclassified Polaromonas TaxID=2638319 RepID=UPI0025E567B8|nr:MULTISPECIES: TetR/AcrR family transcriptional regulator [unclassified Polaromonas]HQS00641.1 TetR/AcrR family transcriptional regulator [Polaromonas sp.]HQS89203.1 TetR/AcrR family transcriptional regulator [Polaromonas sp.]
MNNTEMAKKTSGQVSRLPQILDKAAELFAANGYGGTSTRDIMGSLGMPSGSLYCHFPSKEDLLVAVYKVGVQHVIDVVDQALVGESDPWVRLESACAAHLQAILVDNNYAQVITKIMPEDVPSESTRLTELRDRYEMIFVKAIEDLPLPSDIPRKSLRLLLLGALNWSRIWYRPGQDTPAAIASEFVKLLKNASCTME